MYVLSRGQNNPTMSTETFRNSLYPQQMHNKTVGIYNAI